MIDSKLLVSAAVLRLLVDENKDVYSVLSEFILRTISSRNLRTATLEELTEFLNEDFGFNVPQAVITACIRNRLGQKKHGKNFLIIENSIVKTTEKFDLSSDDQDSFKEKERALNNTYNKLISSLVEYKNKKDTSVSDDAIQSALISLLSSDTKGLDDENSSLAEKISYSFILENKDRSNLTDALNKIEEGLLLHKGLRFTSATNNISKWKRAINIYLDTEHLFNAAGYNGKIYENIFNDFKDLVNESNRKHKESSQKIKLLFLPETEKEIRKFFDAAESIIAKKSNLKERRPAMTHIVNLCRSKSDLIELRAEFYKRLDDLNILREVEIDHNSEEYKQFNLSSDLNVKAITSHSEENEFSLNPEKVKDSLEKLTRVNIARKGVSKRLDEVKAILISESYTNISASHYIGRSEEISVPLCTSIIFITEKLWFTLKKGFGGENATPTIFNIVTKSQLALSSIIQGSVSKNLKELHDKEEKGLISEEDLKFAAYELYSSRVLPEDIESDIAECSEIIFNDEYISEIIAKKNYLESAKIERDKLKQSLKLATASETREQLRIERFNILSKYYLTESFYLGSPIVISLIILILNSTAGGITASIALTIEVALLTKMKNRRRAMRINLMACRNAVRRRVKEKLHIID